MGTVNEKLERYREGGKMKRFVKKEADKRY